MSKEQCDKHDENADQHGDDMNCPAINITDEMVDRALEAAKGAMVDTRRFWTDGDRAAVRAMLAAALPPLSLEAAAQEKCTYCGEFYPKPISLHHSTEECHENEARRI